MMPDPIALRRELHRLPELGFLEVKTSELLKKRMAGLGRIEPLGETGFYVDIGPGDASRTLLLRADMDGLPIQEATGLSYASIHDGHMHACGHDGHMAALVAAAYQVHESLSGDLRVRIFFQPAEEGRGGARYCIEQGVLQGVDAAFGLHLWNELPVGTIALPDGGVMASVVEFEVTFGGNGGHGALPERANNPIYAASLFADRVGNYALDLEGNGALSVGCIRAGDAFNVIPNSAFVKGTARAFDGDSDEAIEQAVRAIGKSIASDRGVDIEVVWKRHHAVTQNSPDFSQLARDAAHLVSGIDNVRTDYRTMAGEDFGEILAEVDGAYALLGSGKADGTSFPHHSPYFDIEERALPLAVALHQEVVRRFGERR